MKYAIGVLSGKHDNKLFSGLMQAILSKDDRDDRGVGMQNFKYAPAWEELCHIIHIHSPRAYRALKAFLPMPNGRTFRMKESRQPRFPMEICDRTFDLVKEHVNALGYKGPVGVSCDETKLFATYRLYWDGSQATYFLVGGVEGPVKVLDAEQVNDTIKKAQMRKATKVSARNWEFLKKTDGVHCCQVRVWCLTIPVPKMTPCVIAALAMPNDSKAEELTELSKKILFGLLACDMQVVSYACDGTETERAVQRQLIAKWADRVEERVIKDPLTQSNIRINIPIFQKNPICMIQDSKHALKTFRNNLFSGARLLVLGNYIAMYSHIRQLAFEDNSPLFLRDVDKLDKQDDNAATRLFSADTLKYLCDNHPDYRGDIVYLFVFGELVDAYQNRSIPHLERLKLVLRARYFLNMWRTCLVVAGYSERQYCLSREALDICTYIIDGFISLIYVHRDYVDHEYPFLPWLHSSEACEHIFGEARKIVKDFTYLDFIYLIPKLRVAIRHAVLHMTTSDPKARASGYAHNYFDTKGVNLTNLATYPSNESINEVAERAAGEADALLALLGLFPHRIRRLKIKETGASHTSLDYDELDDSASIYYEAEDAEFTMLQELLEREEMTSDFRTQRQEKQFNNLACATFALMIDDHTNL